CNLTRQVAPGGIVSTFSYDSRGNLLSQFDPLGNQVSFTYEPIFDQVTSVIDQRFNSTNYNYDERSNLIAIDYPSYGELFDYQRGNLADSPNTVNSQVVGRLESLQNGEDGELSYYDRQGNLVTVFDRTQEQFSYDERGNVTQYVNRRGQEIEYVYDERDRLIRQTNPDGSEESFTYDERDNLISATDANGTITQEFDSADRLTKVTYPNDRSLEFVYDEGGRRTQMIDQDGFTINYIYDDVGRLAALRNGDDEDIVSYSFDEVGRLIREDNGNGTYTTYEYNEASQLLALVNYAPDDSVNSRFDYVYDDLGRTASVTTVEGTFEYGYDANNQLISVNLPEGRTINYAYDAAGNRISVTDDGEITSYNTNNLNQYTSAGEASYIYDADGNLTAKIEGEQSWTYEYDADNRLVTAVTPEGTWSYEYDAFGNRIASIRDGERTEYLLDPFGLGDVVGEYDGDGNLVARYTHGIGLESRIDPLNGANYYDFDAIGSTAGLTGSNGGYVNRYSYLPFGEDLVKDEEVPNPFEYVGQFGLMDEGNGLDFVRARYYMPSEGRFLTPDPIGQDGGVNLYAYVENSPVDLIDINGTDSFWRRIFNNHPRYGDQKRVPPVDEVKEIGKSNQGGKEGWTTEQGKQKKQSQGGDEGRPTQNVDRFEKSSGDENQNLNIWERFVKDESGSVSDVVSVGLFVADIALLALALAEPTPFGEALLAGRLGARLGQVLRFLKGPGGEILDTIQDFFDLAEFLDSLDNGDGDSSGTDETSITPPPPPPPQPGATSDTFNDPRLVSFDRQLYDFQAVGEFILVESDSGDLNIQVRQEPVGASDSVSQNTAVATIIDGIRIGLYTEGDPLLIDGVPTEIGNRESIAVGSGRIYRSDNTYTIVYEDDNPDSDQLVTTVFSNRVNLSTFLSEARQGSIAGLLGNFNNNPDDDITTRDGTVLEQPVSTGQLYGQYANSWRITQEESLFDYNPGENTDTFTDQSFPAREITLDDLDPVLRAQAEQLVDQAGITDPALRQTAIIDLVFTDFDPTIIEGVLASQIPETTLDVITPLTAVDDSASTEVNVPVTVNILDNDSAESGRPNLDTFDETSTAGGSISLDDNDTPDNPRDDQLTYTPPANFVGTDEFTYTIVNGEATETAVVRVTVSNLIDLSNLDGRNGFVIPSSDPGNLLGTAVSKIGDFNGDNIDDIVIGALGADPDGNNGAGETYILFGRDGNFPENINPSNLNGNNGITIEGTDIGSFSGSAVNEAGDVNNDGIDDIIIGAFGSDNGDNENTGKAYIVFGSDGDLPPNINLSDLNGNNGFAVAGVNEFEYAGLAVGGSGDFNGDGIDDIFISAPGLNDGSPSKTYIVFGRDGQFPDNIDLSELDGDNGFVINDESGQTGETVSKAGDINNDGIADIIIGASTGGEENYVVYGSGTGFPAEVELSDLNQNQGLSFTGMDLEDAITTVSGLGDVNQDGIDDLAIAVSGINPEDGFATNKSYVVFGQNNLPGSFNLSNLDGTNGFAIEGIGFSNNPFPISISEVGDFNKDGIGDIIIGAPQNTGQTYIVFGRDESFPAEIDLSTFDPNIGLVVGGVDFDERSGTAVDSAGDLNNDGVDDLIIGAPGSFSGGTPGKSYVVFGNAALNPEVETIVGDNEDNTLEGGESPEIIQGLGGQDRLIGNEGNDSINGGTGSDRLVGGEGEDELNGSSGNDTLLGTSDNDLLIGRPGNDIMLGGEGDDQLEGGIGRDRLNGGPGNDVLTGGGSIDRFIFNTNEVFLSQDVGTDEITDFSQTQGDIVLLDLKTFTAISSDPGEGFSVVEEYAVVASDQEAETSNAIITYNSNNGNLFYNPNGSETGLGSGGQFATLTNTPLLAAGDFVIRG
ncbi:MAG: hypothetical protein F6K39_19355, partial [Okeania sp. SIO3B3]|nr:hypothetical protein [Okeania sp. SIO3B3]